MQRSIVFAATAAACLRTGVSWTWTSAPLEGDAPRSSHGHTFSRVLRSGVATGVLCGGYNETSGAVVSGCYELAPAQSGGAAWSSRAVVLPASAYPRAMHVAVAYGDFLLLLGGSTTDPDPNNPEVFSIPTWTRIGPTQEQFGGSPPSWRMEMASTLWHGNFLFIHGGLAVDDGSDLSDAALLYLGDGIRPYFNWSFVRPACLTCPTPGARHAHAVAAWGADTLVLVGGATETGAVLGDVWLLTYVEDRGTWSWVQRGSTPEPLSAGSAHVVGDLLIYYGGTAGRGAAGAATSGGLRVLSLKDFSWSIPPSAGEWTRLPLWAGAALLPPAAGSSEVALAICGGAWDNSSASVPPPQPAATRTIAILSGIGVEPAPPAPALLLAASIGGGVVALFISLVASYFLWHRCRPSSGGKDEGETTALLYGAHPAARKLSRVAVAGAAPGPLGGSGGGGSSPTAASRSHLQRADGSAAGGIQMAAISARLRAGTAAAVAEAASYAAASAAAPADDAPALGAPLLTLPGAARYGGGALSGAAAADGSASPLRDGSPLPFAPVPPHAFLRSAGRQRSFSTAAVLQRGGVATGPAIPEATRSGESSSATSRRGSASSSDGDARM